jgi:8-oxo-dGTP diphosphatase
MPDEYLTAHDILNKPHKQLKSKFIDRVSVYGVLKTKTKILVQRNPHSSKYSLPGGGIEIGESPKEALIREFEEETGILIKPGKVLDVGNSLFTWGETFVQNTLIIYSVEYLAGDIHIQKGMEDSAEARYMSFTDLKNGMLQEVYKQFEDSIYG